MRRREEEECSSFVSQTNEMVSIFALLERLDICINGAVEEGERSQQYESLIVHSLSLSRERLLLALFSSVHPSQLSTLHLQLSVRAVACDVQE